MSERKQYEMTEEQLSKILEASKPTPVMKIGSHFPATVQENANWAWIFLGRELSFDPMTVKPVAGMSQRHFSAMPEVK
jgi:hypothetical protein